MNTKKMAKRLKDSGVSPVIATILMVAITVVLAAVLYVMVSGFTHSPGTAQSAGLTSSQSSSTSWVVTVSSVSASNINLANLKMVVSGASVGGTASVGKYDGNGSALYSASATTFTVSSTNTAGLTVTWGVLSGNSGTYLQSGDTITLTMVTNAVGSMSGATVVLYNGNSQLGSVTL